MFLFDNTEADLAALEQYRERLRPLHYEILKTAILKKSYDGVAADLHIPLGTVKSRLHRAHKALAAAATPTPQEQTNG